MSETKNEEHITRIKSKNESFLKKDLNTLDFSKKRNKAFYGIILILGLIAFGFSVIVGLVELWKLL